MLFFPNCKINLGLSVIDKRPDGFHDIETIFYPLYINDVLEIVPAQTAIFNHDLPDLGSVDLSISGLPIDGDPSNNLCVKAYLLLQKDFSFLPPVKMHLHKLIPMGAGLGGGSSDGAAALLLLNDLFKLKISKNNLLDYALQLGSDCPFFIINKPSLATSRGEIMEPVELDLSAYAFVLVNPGLHINTGWAFSQLKTGVDKRSQKAADLKDMINSPLATWKDKLVNDFEKPVFEKYPELSLVKEKLYQQGALFSSMSGSGSTIFGIFEKNQVPYKKKEISDTILLTLADFNMTTSG